MTKKSISLNDVIKSAPKMVQGVRGWYFGFGTAVSTAGETVNLYMKISFVAGPYIDEKQNTLAINWAKFNILWIGDQTQPDIPDLENEWKPERTGQYLDGSVSKVGVLLGALHVPMGVFVGVLDRIQWLLANAGALQEWLDASLMQSINGKFDRPMEETLNLICDTSAHSAYSVSPFQPMLRSKYHKYAKLAHNGVKKFVDDNPSDGDSDGDTDDAL